MGALEKVATGSGVLNKDAFIKIDDWSDDRDSKEILKQKRENRDEVITDLELEEI